MIRERLKLFSLVLAATCCGVGCGGIADEGSAVAASPGRTDAEIAARVVDPASVGALETPTAFAAPPRAGIVVSTLAPRISSVRHESAESCPQITPAPADADAIASAPPQRVTADTQARGEAEQADHSRLSSFEASFQREPNDPGWSVAMSHRLRAAFAAADDVPGAAVRDIECGSSSCRVLVDGDRSGQMRWAVPAVLEQIADVLTGVGTAEVDLGNGQRATLLYFSR